MWILKENCDENNKLISVDVEPEPNENEDFIRNYFAKRNPEIEVRLIYPHNIKIGTDYHKVEDIGIWRTVIDVKKIRRF